MRIRHLLPVGPATPGPWLLAASAAGWATLLALGHSGSGHGASGHGTAAGLPPMAAWLVMLVAMMAPLLSGPLGHVRSHSLSPRRARGVGLFLSGYLAVWMAAGAALLALAAGLESAVPPWLAMVLGVGTVAVWQGSPWKQACLNRCHRRPPLSAFGLAADRDCLRFGATKGVWCVGSCWALMLLPLLFGAAGLLVMVLMAFVMLVERWRPARRPAWGSGLRLR